MHSASLITRLTSGVVGSLGLARLKAGERSGAVILMYHGVVERSLDPALEEYAVDVALLREHLAFFLRHFKIVPLAELVAAVREGRDPDPRWVVLTFDDALKNQVTLAASVLADAGAAWALTVPSGLIGSGRSVWSYELELLVNRCWTEGALALPGQPEAQEAARTPKEKKAVLKVLRDRLFAVSPGERMSMMDQLIAGVGAQRFYEQLHAYGNYDLAEWGDVARLAGAGVEILSHGAGHHPLSDRLAPVDWDVELVGSKRTIERELGRSVHGLALPHGVMAGTLGQQVRAAGYGYCLTSQPGRVDAGCDLLEIPRYDAAYSLPALRRFCLG